MNLQQLFIDNWFEENIADIQSITQLPIVKNKDYANMNLFFQKFKQNFAKFNGIVYVNSDGISEVTDSGFEKIDVTARKYFYEAKKGNTYVSDMIIGMKSKEPVITVSFPVMNKDGQFDGLVMGSIHLKTIQHVMDQFQEEIGETYLIDRRGQLVSYSKQGEIGDKIDLAASSNLMAEEGEAIFYKRKNGEPVLGDYRLVNDGKWFIIGEMHKKEINRPFNRILTVFLLSLYC